MQLDGNKYTYLYMYF